MKWDRLTQWRYYGAMDTIVKIMPFFEYTVCVLFNKVTSIIRFQKWLSEVIDLFVKYIYKYKSSPTFFSNAFVGPLYLFCVLEAYPIPFGTIAPLPQQNRNKTVWCQIRVDFT